MRRVLPLAFLPLLFGLGCAHAPPPPATPSPPEAVRPEILSLPGPSEEWFGVYKKGVKVAWIHTRHSVGERGGLQTLVYEWWDGDQSGPRETYREIFEYADGGTLLEFSGSDTGDSEPWEVVGTVTSGGISVERKQRGATLEYWVLPLSGEPVEVTQGGRLAAFLGRNLSGRKLSIEETPRIVRYAFERLPQSGPTRVVRQSLEGSPGSLHYYGEDGRLLEVRSPDTLIRAESETDAQHFEPPAPPFRAIRIEGGFPGQSRGSSQTWKQWSVEEDGIATHIIENRPRKPVKRLRGYFRTWSKGHACVAQETLEFPETRLGKRRPQQITFRGICEAPRSYIARILLVDSIVYEFHVDTDRNPAHIEQLPSKMRELLAKIRPRDTGDRESR